MEMEQFEIELLHFLITAGWDGIEMKDLIILFALMCLFAGCQDQYNNNPQETGEDIAGDPEFETGAVVTLTGLLISPLCFGDENPGNHDDSLECAINNTKMGAPVALLESGKSPYDAWILLTIPQIFEDYMGQRVRVTGSVTSQGVLTPMRVEWNREDAWVFIM